MQVQPQGGGIMHRVMRMGLRPRWPLVAVLLAAFNLRVAVSVTSPLLTTLETHLGLSREQASLLGSLSPLAFGVAGLGGLAAVRTLGLERCAVVALALAAAGQVGRAAFGSPLLFLAFSALALVGMGLGNVVVPPLVKRYFPHNLTLVTGLYVVMLQLGTAVAAQGAVPVAERFGWRVSLAVWGVVAAVAAAAWAVVPHRSPGRSGSAGPAQRLPLALVARSPLVRGLTLLFGCQSLGAYTIFAWLPSVYHDAGLAESVGGSAVAVYAVFQIPMSLFAPVILGRWDRPFRLTAIFMAANLVAYLGLGSAPDRAPLLWAALLGIGSGAFPVALALIGMRTSTAAGAASLSSFAQGIGYFIAVLGPLVTGLLRSASGGWGAPLVFLALVAVPVLIGAALVSRPQTLETEVTGESAPAG